jgi:CSLREA domain-containing protein
VLPTIFRRTAAVACLVLLLLGLVRSARPYRAEAAVFTVNSTADAVDADVNDHICATATPGECTLRAAIQQANASGGGEVVVPAGTYTLSIPGANEDGAASGDLDINVPLTITGAGAADTIIDGGGLDRVFDIAPAVTSGSPIVEVDDVTIRGGNCFCTGGGVLNHGA